MLVCQTEVAIEEWVVCECVESPIDERKALQSGGIGYGKEDLGEDFVRERENSRLRFGWRRARYDRDDTVVRHVVYRVTVYPEAVRSSRYMYELVASLLIVRSRI